MAKIYLRTGLVAVGTIALVVIAVTNAQPDLFLLMRAGIPDTITTEEEETFVCNPPQDLSPGQYVFAVQAEDQAGLTTVKQITINVERGEMPTPSSTQEPSVLPTVSPVISPILSPEISPVLSPAASPVYSPLMSPLSSPASTVTPGVSLPTPPASSKTASGGEDSDGSSLGGGSSSGGDSGGSSSEGSNLAAATQARSFTYQAESGHSIVGRYSGVEKTNGGGVVTIAHEKAILYKTVNVPKDTYYMFIRTKHDMPGPVDMAVYVNNRAWKVLRLDKNDNRFRTHRIGLLRDFEGAKVAFRFINDSWRPGGADLDRNLQLDWWALSTSSKQPSIVNKQLKILGTSGRAVLPRLNQIIREELGGRFVTPRIWYYYAKRLVISPTETEVIKSEEHLRQVMRYWKGIKPYDPRG